MPASSYGSPTPDVAEPLVEAGDLLLGVQLDLGDPLLAGPALGRVHDRAAEAAPADVGRHRDAADHCAMPSVSKMRAVPITSAPAGAALSRSTTWAASPSRPSNSSS